MCHSKGVKMAIPFNIPDEVDGSHHESSQSATSRPIQIPVQNSQSPQLSPIDNDMIVQAFYEALCRCSQNFPQFSPTPTPSSPFNGHFWFPSPATSSVSSPRSSFRSAPRRRLNSYGNQSQFSEESIEEFNEDDLVAWEHHCQHREHLEEFSGQIPPQPKAKTQTPKSSKKPKQRSNKFTNFVISALQLIIDSLK